MNPWMPAFTALLLSPLAALRPGGTPLETNSIGMRMIPVEPGEFIMGSTEGDFDEEPKHAVRITRPFWMAATQVSNAQYEQFDPTHKRYRGMAGFSNGDNEAALFVSWHDAVAFCEWLSAKEDRLYRLPTEAQWEYACRAGTTTEYHTGDALPESFHRCQGDKETPQKVALDVEEMPSNGWGMRGMHGNVEEWCADWYGPYEPGDQTDPAGRVNGDFRVTRGGSHNTDLRYLRSANRSGALPEDRHWLLGFRVVRGKASKTKLRPPPAPSLYARDVSQEPADWTSAPDVNKPQFFGPVRYVKIPEESNGPLFSKHNHCPGLAYCANGDLLAIWFTCQTEQGRELSIAVSRLRRGADEWEPASPFWAAPDRNNHAPALWHDGHGTLYHFNGLAAGCHLRKNLALVMRTSTDNGASWSPAKLINPERGLPSQPVTTIFTTPDGRIVLPVDAPWRREGGATALWSSTDGGKTWGLSEGVATGIHAGVAMLRDGRMLAFGRYIEHDAEFMPQSISTDMGQTWTTSDSVFAPIEQGQRPVLMRLREGPLLFVSFTDNALLEDEQRRGMVFDNSTGGKFTGYGLFAAISTDDGATWPIRKLIAGDQSRKPEIRGYLAATQTPDGLIHLISSVKYYRFNLAWLKQPSSQQ